MDKELPGLKLYEIIKGIRSSNESLDRLADLILKASTELDVLIKVQSEMYETYDDKMTVRKT